jgi:hypothetical protein
LKRVAVARDADDEQEEDQEENGARQQLAEIAQALIEGGLLRTGAEAGRNIAKGGPAASRHDLCGCGSADDRCAQEDHVGRIRFGRSGLRSRLLLGGERLARQRRL